MTSRTTEADRLRARKCWRTLEAYHGFIYFAAEAAEEYAALDVRGRTGYFLSRSAAMGRVSASTVIATFYNFHPDLVSRAMAEAPDSVTAEAMVDARYRAVDRVLRTQLGPAVESDEMRRAAALATKAQTGIDELSVGRPLALAHAGLDQPEEPHLQLWWAITTLREFRGDGHLTALVDAELSGLEALIMHAASGEVAADTLKTTRDWNDDEWAAGIEGLVARDLVDEHGAFTPAGAALRTEIEDRTDRLAASAWANLSDDEGAELRGLVRPWSKLVFGGLLPT